MAFYYFDASALVKYYILEPGSTWVRGTIDAADTIRQQSAHAIIIADVSVAEVSAAFAVLHRTGRIRQTVWDGVFDKFMSDVDLRYQFVETGPNDFFAAAALTRKHPLKAYDAVQLATALRYNRILALQQLSMTFVSGDKTLLTAAQAEGAITDNPFDHISPQDTPA